MKKKAVLAFLLSSIVASQSSMVAFAEVNVDLANPGQITVSSVVEETDGQSAVYVYGEGNSVTVNGDVTTTGDGSPAVKAADDGSVIVSGDVATSGKDGSDGVNVWGENSQVQIGGNIDVSGAGSSGVKADFGGSQVVVGGDITVSGELLDDGDEVYGIRADSNSQITVEGNVSSKNGEAILACGEASVSVKGDASSSSSGYTTIVAGDEASVTIGGDVYADGDGCDGVSTFASEDQEKGAVVEIKGDVIVTGGEYSNSEYGYGYFPTGINAGTRSTINVGGNVSSKTGEAVRACNGATVNIGGDVTAGENEYYTSAGVSACGNATVNVGGNVTGGRGIDAEDGVTVTVDGDVFATQGTGVRAVDGSTVIVGGDVTGTQWKDRYGACGISTQSGCTVIVDNGTVTSGTEGVGIEISVFDSQQKGLVVAKKVAVDDKSIAVLVASTYQGGSYIASDGVLFNPETAEELYNALPEMIFGELQANEYGEYVAYATSAESSSQEKREAFEQAILNKINYMIDVQKVENGTISVAGTSVLEGYEVAKRGSALLVTITPDDGYEVTSLSGGKATVVKNEDGTYTITVLDGGGINISAVISAIKVANAVAQEQDSASQNVMTQAELIKAEEAIPVTVFASETAVNAIPAEAKEVVAEDSTTIYNLSSVKTMQGFVAAVNKIAKADPVASTVAVYSEKPVTLDVAALNSIEEMDKDFVYMSTYKGHLYKVTIPAGFKVDLRGAKSAGPLFIGAVLGTTEILK